jgi:hypothetical protein
MGKRLKNAQQAALLQSLEYGGVGDELDRGKIG